ncbi:MAG: nif-specific transcriptional activator NifA [Pseudomonadota bacterium]
MADVCTEYDSSFFDHAQVKNDHERFTLEAVYEVSKILTGAIDPISEFPQVLNILSSFIGLRFGALALLAEPDGDGATPLRNPYVIAATIRGSGSGAPVRTAIPEPVARMVFKTGVPFVSWNLAAEFGEACVPPHMENEDYTVIAVPVREQERTPLVVGVLCAFRSHDDDRAAHSDGDINILTMVASLLEQSLRFRRIVARDRKRVMNEVRNRDNSSVRAGEDFNGIGGIIGKSAEIYDVIERIKKAARTTAPILLRGESGTGKELFARAAHSLSERKNKPFIRVNCAALSETLLESELFGHEKGAFTGAQARKKGRFELANQGTLFLDEIGEISPSFQTKLLRVLQEGEFERVGGTDTIKVDVRVISATNRDLEVAVAEGTFRADLYFRICVVPVILPPLRERQGDIKILADTFLDQFNKENRTSFRLAEDAVDTICQCKFPGNVRELENCIRRAAALSTGDEIEDLDLACNQGSCLSAELWRLQTGESSPIGGLAAGHVVQPVVTTNQMSAPAGCPMQPQSKKSGDIEKQDLLNAMEQAGWVQAKAARILSITPRQISYALKKHGIEIQRF